MHRRPLTTSPSPAPQLTSANSSTHMQGYPTAPCPLKNWRVRFWRRQICPSLPLAATLLLLTVRWGTPSKITPVMLLTMLHTTGRSCCAAVRPEPRLALVGARGIRRIRRCNAAMSRRAMRERVLVRPDTAYPPCSKELGAHSIACVHCCLSFVSPAHRACLCDRPGPALRNTPLRT